jgi:DNA-binding NtrC family response regulator
MSNRMLALVADDTDLGRWALAHALQARGFEVYTAATWVEAAGWLGRTEVSVALVSASLESEGAPDMAAYLRTHHPTVHVIFLADQDEMPWVRQWCGQGAEVFAKPLDVEQVVVAAAAKVEEDRRARRA